MIGQRVPRNLTRHRISYLPLAPSKLPHPQPSQPKTTLPALTRRRISSRILASLRLFSSKLNMASAAFSSAVYTWFSFLRGVLNKRCVDCNDCKVTASPRRSSERCKQNHAAALCGKLQVQGLPLLGQRTCRSVAGNPSGARAASLPSPRPASNPTPSWGTPCSLRSAAGCATPALPAALPTGS